MIIDTTISAEDTRAAQTHPFASHTGQEGARKEAAATGCVGAGRGDEVWGRGPQPSFYYKSFLSSLCEGTVTLRTSDFHSC